MLYFTIMSLCILITVTCLVASEGGMCCILRSGSLCILITVTCLVATEGGMCCILRSCHCVF